MKKFLLSIFCLFCLVGFATAEEVTFVAQGAIFSGENGVTMDTGNIPGNVYTSENIELSLTQKSSSTSNVHANGHVRWYKYDILNVAAKNGVVITSIVFNIAGESKYCVAPVANSGTVTANTESLTITWTGEVDNILELAADNGQIRFTTMTITYTADSSETPAVATPTFSVEAGTQYNPFSVEIAAEEGATVYYTTDGTEPTAESTQYTKAIAFNKFGTSATIKAIAVVDGEQSNIASATYSLKVAAPTFSVKGGVYERLTDTDALKFTCETKGATIYYNNRGGDPITEGSKSYSSTSISVLSTVEIKAVAYIEVEGEKIYSDVVSENYYISPIMPHEKVTEFTEGEYIIYSEGVVATALSETSNYGFLPQFAVEAKGNFIETNAFYAFTFTEVEGGYTIQDTFGRYVYQTDKYNSFNVAKDMPEEGAIWTVAIDETTGEARITNTSVNKYIQYSSQYNSYGSYATTQDNGHMPFLYKQYEYPTITVTPENGDTIPAFNKVSITCESGIQYNETKHIYPYYTIGWDNERYEFDDVKVVDEKTIELTLSEPIQENGEYKVNFPAGLFILNPNGLATPNEKAKYTYIVENLDILDVTYANPDKGASVKSIEYLYFEYSQNITAQVEGAVITNEYGDEFPLTVSDIDAWGGTTLPNAISLKSAERITTPGVYTFVLKKEYAQTDAGVILSEDITYTFTLVEGLKITDFTPIVNTEISAVEEIYIEFNQEFTCLAEAFMIIGEDGAEYHFEQAMEEEELNELSYNMIHLVTKTPISNAGTYTLKIEDGNIVDSDGDALPAQTLTFTFDGSNVITGIEEVKGANENAKTIYDLTGRKIEKITKPGIYIVGGKKVLVK